MRENHQYVYISVLDRLIDKAPESSYEPVRQLSIGQIKAFVRRDLENLLNTKRQILPPGFPYQKINTSVLVYGLYDFSSCNPQNITEMQALKQDIKKTISLFEPRLQNISVHVDTPNRKEHLLRFSITGLLVLDPIKEPVSFDTYFDVAKGEYRISE